MSLDKFPEAFERSERDGVPYGDAEDFNQFKMMFASWGGPGKELSPKQKQALYKEWIRYEAKLHGRRFREKTFTSYLGRAGQFSPKYGNYEAWYIQKARTSSYEVRIQRYIERHPNATLAEARGHKRR